MKNSMPLFGLIGIIIVTIIAIIGNYWFEKNLGSEITPAPTMNVIPTITPFPTVLITPSATSFPTYPPTLIPTSYQSPTPMPQIQQSPIPIPTSPQNTVLTPSFLKTNTCQKTFICSESNLIVVNTIITAVDNRLTPIELSYQNCVADAQSHVNECADLPCMTYYASVLEGCETTYLQAKDPIVQEAETKLSTYGTIIGCE